jgi:arabinan endo-1,5-alpha-L-arabinosidase
MVTDAAGQDWIVYHAIDRSDPYLDGTDGINERPMLIDRLTWPGGWPLVRGGRGPSEDVHPAPATSRRAASPAPSPIAPARPGRLDRSRSDEFTGTTLASGWQQVRTPTVRLADGSLVWPTEAGDLTGPGGTASLLLRTPPADGTWTIETKVSIDLGETTVRNFQQAGLVVYADDDLFTRLSHVAIWNTRQTEFGKEMPYVGRTSYGGTIIGPPAATTWLRITARPDRTNRELELTGSTSRDGRSWVHGGTRTLPADAAVRVGLVSHGRAAADPAATARFDYFRLYQD